MEILKIENLTKIYGEGENQVRALDGVSFSVEKGEFPVLDVVENMTLPVLMDGRQVNGARLEELLETLGLQDRRKNLPNQLSGGQQQRVSIGRALMNAPAVVLADEPTGNLDSRNSQEIVELLKFSNRKYGQTLIVITHDESIALQADRVIAIEDGHIVRDERIRG